MSPLVILVLLGLTATTYAVDCRGDVGGEDELCEPWDQNRITWSPGTVAGTTKNFVAQSIADVGALGPCVHHGDNGAKWYGYRSNFKDHKANSVFNLYDVNGFIAGVQVRIRKSQVNLPGSNFNHSAVPMFQSETVGMVSFYVLTAYFADPALICTTGRVIDGASDMGGDRLVFQNGPDPETYILAPNERKNAIGEGSYTQNTCFYTMGYHTFFDVPSWADTGCNEITPVFLLFNADGYLIGFGFDWVGLNDASKDDGVNSPFFETPGSAAIKKIVGADICPQCILDYADDKATSVTTMHYFFVYRNPAKICQGYDDHDLLE